MKYVWEIHPDGIGPLRIGASREEIRKLLYPFVKEEYSRPGYLFPFPTDFVEEIGIGAISYTKDGRCYYISIDQPLVSKLLVPNDLQEYLKVKYYKYPNGDLRSINVLDKSLEHDYNQPRLLRCSISTYYVNVKTYEGEQLLGLDFGESFLQAAHRLGKKTDVFTIEYDQVTDDYALRSKDSRVILRFCSPGIFSGAEFVPPECPGLSGDCYFAGSYDELVSWIKRIDSSAVEEEDRIVSYKKGLTVLLASSGDRTAPPRSVIYRSEYEQGSFRNFSSIWSGTPVVGHAVKLMTEVDVEELVQERFELLTDNKNDFCYFGASEAEVSSELDGLGKLGHPFRQLLCQAPERLQSYQEEFLRRNVFHYPLVFKDAPSNIRDSLLSLVLSLVEGDVQKLLGKIPLARTYRLLESLTWIGDEEVQRFFSTLPEFSRLSWSYNEEEGYFSSIGTMVDFKHLPHRAGWELLPDARRRDLVFWQRFGLAPAVSEKELLTATSKFLSVQKKVSELSGAPLFLYFKIDLTDPRFHFLGIEGTSLRLITDPFCITQGHFKLTSEGGCTFIPAPDLSVPKYTEGSLAFPEIPHTVSPLPTSPYNTSDGAGVTFPSYLGGLPYCNGFLHYPPCPECSRRMMFFMYFGGMGGDMKDGLQSLLTFLCRECLVVKVIENDHWQ